MSVMKMMVDNLSLYDVFNTNFKSSKECEKYHKDNEYNLIPNIIEDLKEISIDSDIYDGDKKPSEFIESFYTKILKYNASKAYKFRYSIDFYFGHIEPIVSNIYKIFYELDNNDLKIIPIKVKKLYDELYSILSYIINDYKLAENAKDIGFNFVVSYISNPFIKHTCSDPIQHVNKVTLYRTMFKPYVMYNRIMVLSENSIKDNRLIELANSYVYNPGTEKYKQLKNKINNEASDEVKNIFYSVLHIYCTVANEVGYWLTQARSDLFDFYKCVNENIDYEIDSDGYVSHVPSILRCVSYYNEMSTEAVPSNGNPMTQNQVNNLHMNQLDEKYKSKFIKLQKTFTEIFTIKPNKRKIESNSKFFKQWVGRVPGMLSRYGNEANVVENRMKGDPTQILLTSGVKYLSNISEQTQDIFNEILTAAKKVTSGGDLNAKINAIKTYCKQYPIDSNDADPKIIKKQIVNETIFRLANAILQENGIYGFTAEGIVENGKFPTANHIVVSLFSDNPEEEAEEISVSSIFQSPDSINIFAYPEKLRVIENAFASSSSKIVNSFNPRMVSAIHKNMNNNYRLFANNLTRKNNSLDDGALDGSAEDVGRAKKVVKAIEDGIIEGLDYVIDQKRRAIQCLGVMYEMTDKISNLAKKCIASLHQCEVKHSDTKFKSGINNVKNARTINYYNKYDQAHREGGRFRDKW